jgi:uncharacterized protein YegP (UPF0339 family)
MTELTIKQDTDGQWRVRTRYNGITLDVVAMGATKDEAVSRIPVQYRSYPIRTQGGTR